MRPTFIAAVLAVATLPSVASAQSLSGAALDGINQQRQAQGLAPFGTNSNVGQAAMEQAAHMAQIGEITHSGPNGQASMARVKDEGYEACFAAENVAYGQSSAEAVVSAWMNSNGHRANILSSQGQVAAVAQAQASDGTPYWAMIVAAPC